MKIFIENKNKEKIAVIVEGIENKSNKKLAIFVHGLSGNKEQDMVAIPAQVFKDNGYVVIRFDTRFTLGESFGEHEQSTFTHSLEDLYTIIDWASQQDFYAEPIALSGHSLGGGVVLKYAEENPDRVEIIVPICSTFSGDMLEKTWRESPIRRPLLETLEKEGKALRVRSDNPDMKGYITYEFIKDLKKYDVIKDADKLNMPILLIAGDKDPSSTIYNNQVMFEAVKGDITLKIITNASHVFDTEQNKKEFYDAIYTWLKERN